MSDWLSDPVGALSDTASNWGNSAAGIWHDVSAPFVDNPYGRMAVNYATGGMSAPLYAAYDYSQGKKVGPMQLAGAVSGASNAYDAYNAADAASTAGTSYGGWDNTPAAGDTSGGWGSVLPEGAGGVASAAGSAANYASDFQGDYSGYTNPGESIGGNYGGGNDLQQNITQAGNSMYPTDPNAANYASDFQGDYPSGLSQMWDKYGKFALPALKLGGGLYGMFAQRRMAADMRQQAGDIQNQINSYYSPNSPEAQLMRQRMERLDARAGRNSQYGVRETDLAAKMAQARMGAYNQALPSLTSLYGGANALNAGDMQGLFRAGGDILSNKDVMSSLAGMF